MNAQELYQKDGKPTGVYFCGTCRVVHSTQAAADACCVTPTCRECGSDKVRPHLFLCPTCANLDRDRRESEKEKLRFEAAEKIQEQDWDGWVCCEGISHQDGYFQSTGELRDYLAWSADDGAEENVPEYVWACKKNAFVKVGLDDIMRVFEDEGWEDFDSDDVHGKKELEAALQAFMEANKDVVSYLPDYTKAILLKRDL